MENALEIGKLPPIAHMGRIGEVDAMNSLFPPPQAWEVPDDAGPSGWLYVLSNFAIPAQVKIGFSCTDVWERVRQLQSQTANAGIFILEMYYDTPSVERHEKAVFEILDRFRVMKNREFFVITPELAYFELTKYFNREPDYVRQQLRASLRKNGDSP